MKPLTIATLAMALTSTLTEYEARAQTYSEIVAFGASLTDGGNAYIVTPDIIGYAHPPSPPNFEGRFSNGPSWLDFLADRIGVNRPVASLAGGNNYAYGGATTGAVPNRFGVVDMDAQVEEYLNEKSVLGDELFVVAGWAAANDFSQTQPDPADPADTARKVGQSVDMLASAGATDILVTLGMYISAHTNTDRVAPYNVALQSELAALRARHPGTTISEFNGQPLLDAIFANPSSIGVRFADGQACNDCRIGVPNPVDIADDPNDYVSWDGLHLTTPPNEAIGRAAFKSLPSPYLIDEDFADLGDQLLPDRTRLVLDSNIGQPWGPSIITRENGTIRFQTTGEVPPHSPPELPLETGVMALTWEASESDPKFSDGYLRATLRADTPSDANLILRSDIDNLSGYLFTGLGAIGRFQAYCFCDGGGKLLGEISEPEFEVGRDYHMEVGTVGDRVTMKVWAVGEEEPTLPQLVVFDDRLSQGAVGLIPASSPTMFITPTRVDVSYDSVTFLSSVLADLNGNSVVDVGDIDQLADAIRSGNQHQFYDLNQDGVVDNEDRLVWVQDPSFANTYFGDANLDGMFDSGDLIEVFQADKYESMEGAGWAEGDWNGDGRFGSGDLIAAFQGNGYERGPRPSVNAVPEPAFGIWIVAVMICVFRFRNMALADGSDANEL